MPSTLETSTRPARCFSIEAANSAAVPRDHDLSCGGRSGVDRRVVQRSFYVGCDAITRRLRQVTLTKNSNQTVEKSNPKNQPASQLGCRAKVGSVRCW